MVELSFNIWGLLLLIGVFQGIYLIPVALKNGRVQGRILASLIFIITFNLINYLMINVGLYRQVPFLLMVPEPFLFLIGPIYLYYIRSLTNDLKWHWTGLLHLIPFLGAIFYHSGFFALSGSQKVELVSMALQNDIQPDTTVIVYVALHTFQTLAYLHYANIVLRKKGKLLKTKQRKWLKTFSTLFGGYWLIIFTWIIYLVSARAYFQEADYVIMLSASIFLLCLGYYATYHQPVFLRYGAGESRIKYRNSTISNEQSVAIMKRLIKLMEGEKPFLDPDLKMSDLANRINTSTNILSQVLNQQLNKNFYEFLNEYRITEAIKKLSDTKYDHYTIMGIAMDSGFNTKNTFNRLFKKHTGLTPKEYLKKNVNSSM